MARPGVDPQGKSRVFYWLEETGRWRLDAPAMNRFNKMILGMLTIFVLSLVSAIAAAPPAPAATEKVIAPDRSVSTVTQSAVLTVSDFAFKDAVFVERGAVPCVSAETLRAACAEPIQAKASAHARTCGSVALSCVYPPPLQPADGRYDQRM